MTFARSKALVYKGTVYYLVTLGFDDGNDGLYMLWRAEDGKLMKAIIASLTNPPDLSEGL